MRKQLRMLMTVDVVRRAAEHVGEGGDLHDLGAQDFRIEPSQQAGAQQFRE